MPQPQSTRNFWISAAIDGRETTLEGGPRGRRGEFSLTIYIRDNGGVLRAVSIAGQAKHDGTLVIAASAAGDVAQSETGHVEMGATGFTVTTQAGYKPERPPRAARSSSAHLTRELLRNPPPPPVLESTPPCPYLANDVPSREDCALNGCHTCRAVIENEAERAAANLAAETYSPPASYDPPPPPLGHDPFGHPINRA